MAKSFFRAALLVSFVALSQQQSTQEQLTTFRRSLEIDNLVTTARRLSNDISAVVTESQTTYTATIFKGLNLIDSALTSVANKSLEYIKESAAVASASGSAAAKYCVSRAQSESTQLINQATMKALECIISVSLKMSSFATRVASLDIGPTSTLATSTFRAVSKCPSSFLIENLEDLNSAKACYTEAAAELTTYINQTSKQLEEFQNTLKELQQESSICLTKGTDAVIKEEQTIVDNMVVCGKAAGVLLLPASVISAINSGVAKIDEYLNNSSKIISEIYLTLNNYTASFTYKDISVKAEVEMSMGTTIDLINFVSRFLSGSGTFAEYACLLEAEKGFDKVLASVVETTKYCFADAIQRKDTTIVQEAEAKFQAIQAEATSGTLARCTKGSTITEANVNRCFADALFNIQTDMQTVLDDLKIELDSAKALLVTGDNCLEAGKYRAPREGDNILDKLAACLEIEGVVFQFDRL